MAVVEVSKNENAVDPVEVYQKRQERERQEKELRDHKWTWAEVEELENRTKDASDLDAAREWTALKPYIDASHSRQEFSYPWELSRRDAQAYIEGKGVTGPVWSTREVAAIGRDPVLFAEYGNEARAAVNNGQVIDGPGTLHGRIYHFANESDETFQKEFHRKLIDIDQRRTVEKTIAETASMLPTIKTAGVPKHYLEVQLAKIWEDDTDWYPVDELPGYTELQDAYLLTGGSLSDISAIRASLGKMRHPFLERK
jgi:hypothetical protein